MNQDEFDRVCDAMVAAWPNWKPNVGTVTFAETLLGDLDFDDTIGAVAMMALESPAFHPGVGAIRNKVVDLFRLNILDVDEAWIEVTDAIRRIGHIGTPEWSSPLVAQSVRAMGGWQQVCESTNLPADRAHFARFYEAGAARARAQGAMPPAVAARVAIARGESDGPQSLGASLGALARRADG